MNARVTLVGPHLQRFFAEHLAMHKHASPGTVASYRDAFRLLLQFMQDTTRIAPTALPVAAIDADASVMAIATGVRRRAPAPLTCGSRSCARDLTSRGSSKPQRMAEKALTVVVQEACVQGDPKVRSDGGLRALSGSCGLLCMFAPQRPDPADEGRHEQRMSVSWQGRRGRQQLLPPEDSRRGDDKQDRADDAENPDRHRVQLRNADKEKRGRPHGGTGGECRHAASRAGRGAREKDAFSDRKHEKAASHDVIPCSEVFHGEQPGGRDNSSGIDRPQDRLQVLLRDHEVARAAFKAAVRCYPNARWLLLWGAYIVEKYEPKAEDAQK
jgi:hypothetical protein